MKLQFEMGREDLLAFNREFYKNSPTFQKTRTRVRLMLPLMMLALWAFTTFNSGFEMVSTLTFLGVSVLWYVFYPTRYDRSVEKYVQKTIDEGNTHKEYGPCEITLAEDGLHSLSPSGEAKLNWSSIDRATVTDQYLYIFLNTPNGYPIALSQIGNDTARQAADYINARAGK